MTTAHASSNRAIISAVLALESIRSSGYQDSAYAVAELVDNAVDAGARNIEIILTDTQIQNPERVTRQVDQLAVIDDGDGMDKQTLTDAPRYGESGVRNRPTSIGTYGFGLLASTLSQCKRLDIYSWKNGIESALWTYIDLVEIEQLGVSNIPEVPEPKSRPIPEPWLELASYDYNKTKTGSLIIWSNMDRFRYKRAETAIHRISAPIGRIHRKYIYDKSRTIRVAAYRDGQAQHSVAPNDDGILKANDPLYLMVPSQTPAPFDNDAMFEQFDAPTKQFEVEVAGVKHPVFVTCTRAKPQNLHYDGKTAPGSKEWGKHARDNTGVSIVREHRELSLIPNITAANAINTRSRWWGIEIAFGKALDEYFGVNNSKQNAIALENALKSYSRLDQENQEDSTGLTNELILEDENRQQLYEIAKYVHDTANRMLRGISLIRDTTQQDPDGLPDDQPEQTAEDLIKAQSEEQPTVPESGEELKKLTEETAEHLEPEYTTPEQAMDEASRIVINQYPASFGFRDIQSSAFFQTAELPNGSFRIIINTTHHLYQYLRWIRKYGLDKQDGEAPEAYIALLLILYSFARYERSLTSDEDKRNIIRTRERWGDNVNDAINELKLYRPVPPDDDDDNQSPIG